MNGRKRVFVIILTLLCLSPLFSLAQLTSPGLDSAYVHLNEIMDQYHKTFDVFTNYLAGGNNFYPAIIGDYEDIVLDTENSDANPFGTHCIKIEYTPNENSENKWAAIQCMYPDTNWGYWQGHDIRGAEKLTLKAKGQAGGEKVEFKLGGVNRTPFHHPNRDYEDSFDLLSTGIVTLSTNWQKYAIDLISTRYFGVYLDGNSGSNNRYSASGWYNGKFNMEVDPNWTVNPYSGESCYKVDWKGYSGNDGYKWNGIVWQYPEGNWGEQSGYDLTGATKLTFYARTDEPGLKVNFFVGLDNMDSCGEVPIDSTWVTLYTDWHQYTIHLQEENLSNVRAGFGFVFNEGNDPDPDGTVFFLDEIKFDLPLSNDLSNIIGGFICSMSEADNPVGCKLYIDDIRYQLSPQAQKTRLNKVRFLESYVTTSDTIDKSVRSLAFVYDNALAMLAYIAKDSLEYWQRAELLGKSFIFAQDNDQDFTDGRIRNAYKSGDLMNIQNQKSTLPMISDEANYGTHTGNIAWAMIAMLAYYQNYNEKFGVQKDEFFVSAQKMGEWIYDNCYDDSGPGGYTGGFEGYGHSKVLWKSIEHNIDVYDAYTILYRITGEQKWLDRAMHAKEFMEALYDPNCPCFLIGTSNLTAINRQPVVEDAQTWAIMALQDKKYFPIIDWSQEHFKTTCNGFTGIDFNDDLDGVWFEGTAHMAIACYMIGDNESYQFYLDELRKARTSPNLNGNGKGIVAACKDGVSTGLNWDYNNRLHIGATAWYMFTELKWNPYTSDYFIPGQKDGILSNLNLPKKFELMQNYPNPFNPCTQIEYNVKEPCKVNLKVYNLAGQVIKELVNSVQEPGKYLIHVNMHEVPSGIYFYQIRMGDFVAVRKMVKID